MADTRYDRGADAGANSGACDSSLSLFDLLICPDDDFDRLALAWLASMDSRNLNERFLLDTVMGRVVKHRQVDEAYRRSPKSATDWINHRTGQDKAYRALERAIRAYQKECAQGDRRYGMVPARPAPPPHWRERIDLDVDPDVFGERWPTVRGIAITVDHVLALIRDGLPLYQIYELFPQLRADDLNACWACDAEGLAGPLIP